MARNDWENFAKENYRLKNFGGKDTYSNYRTSLDKKLKEFVIDYFKECRMVLDIGCGFGEYVHLLNKNGVNCIGVDIINYCLKEAKKRVITIKNENFIIKADASNLPFEKECFDGILSLGLIEHFPNHQEVLERWLSCLKKGGKILLSVPSGKRFDYLISNFLVWLFRKKVFITMVPKRRGFITSFWEYEERWFPHYIKYLLKQTSLSQIKITSIGHLSPFFAPFQFLLPKKYCKKMVSRDFKDDKGFIILVSATK